MAKELVISNLEEIIGVASFKKNIETGLLVRFIPNLTYVLPSQICFVHRRRKQYDYNSLLMLGLDDNLDLQHIAIVPVANFTRMFYETDVVGAIKTKHGWRGNKPMQLASNINKYFKRYGQDGLKVDKNIFYKMEYKDVYVPVKVQTGNFEQNQLECEDYEVLDGRLKLVFKRIVIFNEVHFDKEFSIDGYVPGKLDEYVYPIRCKELVVPNDITRLKERMLEEYNYNYIQEVHIPKSVKILDKKAFYGCTNLKTIDLPNSVIEIGESAFRECSSLESIDIPKSLAKIADNAFLNCTSLRSINIPLSVKHIGENAFRNCSSLENINVSANNESYSSLDGVLFNKDKTRLIKFPEAKRINNYTIPSSVREISYFAFENSQLLKNVVIPYGLDTISACAFSGCSCLESIDLSNVQEIECNAFENCTSLRSVILPKSSVKIKDNAFKGCSSLVSVDLRSVVGLGNAVFEDCTSLKSLVFPENVVSISEKSFSGCSSLKSIDLGCIKEIESNAFEKCTSLKSLFIPNTIVSIESEVFKDCRNLEEIHVNIEDIEECYIDEDAFEGVNYEKCMLYIPSGTRWSYRNHDVFGKFKKIEIDNEFSNEQRIIVETRREREEAEQKQKEEDERKRREEYEREQRRIRENRELEERRKREEKQRKEQDERNMLYRVTHDLKPDRVQVKEYLESKYVRHFYHFTDRRNLASIKRYGGLYSWSYCESHNITIPYAGGGSTSRSLDSFYGLEDYVRLSFCSNHPMMYRLEQEGYDLVLLKISVDVALLEETLFSDMNATDNNHQCGSTLDDLKKVNFVAVRETYLKSTHKYFKYHQAEVLVKTFIPIEKILNIDMFI